MLSISYPQILFHFFSVFFKQTINFYSKLMWKMSLQCPGLGVEHTTSWTRVSSHNHLTRDSCANELGRLSQAKFTANKSLIVKDVCHFHGRPLGLVEGRGVGKRSRDDERLSGDQVAVHEARAFVGVRQEDADAVAEAVENLTTGLKLAKV